MVYRVFNTHNKSMMESINVVFDDSPQEKDIIKDGDDISYQQTYVPTDVPNKGSDIETESTNYEETTINKGPSIRINKDHPINNVREI